MDDGIGKVFQALDQKDMLKNSIVMFVSDNGGSLDPDAGAHASNYPLRGKKSTQWEGGIRVPAAIWSPLLKLDKPRISKQLMHVSDWLPTFYSIGGGDIADLGQIDGYDQWEALMNDSSSPRKHMLQNLDPVLGMSAFRIGDLKMVNGTASDEYNSWYGPSGFESVNMSSSFEWVFKNGSVVKDILVEKGMWIADNPNDVYQQLRVICERPPPKRALACQATKKPCLFNITDDPCEYMDLADQYPDEVNSMLARVAKYEEESIEPQSKPSDTSGDPMCHDFLCVPWLDPEHRTECDYASGSVYSDDVDTNN
ncbi:arylsulfatase I [Caerostris darwini]|uniref:Arylsulfatase I n=1 Tax=Caerostris darwini TaxID=1538125 RepID=A0AAV4MWV4_9ARAC|nr:arylsulfatase I [Caerostris darwini]